MGVSSSLTFPVCGLAASRGTGSPARRVVEVREG